MSDRSIFEASAQSLETNYPLLPAGKQDEAVSHLAQEVSDKGFVLTQADKIV
jgi:hypothetical protein